MNRILFLCLITFLTSCSKDDGNDTNATAINPPDWIIGTWDAENGISVFRFTQNDVIIISMTTELSLKEQLKLMEPNGAEVEESSNDGSYELRITSQGITQIYHFSQEDEDTITWYSNGMELSLQRH